MKVPAPFTLDDDPWAHAMDPDTYQFLDASGSERLSRLPDGRLMLVLERIIIRDLTVPIGAVLNEQQAAVAHRHMTRIEMTPEAARAWLLRRCVPPGLRNLFA